jgi:murein DD-endopeptidase MepM/ murein hydrolase activator NlpD
VSPLLSRTTHAQRPAVAVVGVALVLAAGVLAATDRDAAAAPAPLPEAAAATAAPSSLLATREAATLAVSRSAERSSLPTDGAVPTDAQLDRAAERVLREQERAQEARQEARQDARQEERAEARAAERRREARALARATAIPTSAYTITARFGEAGYWSAGYHTGLDFAAPYGTPVVAAAAGEVIAAAWDGAYGNKVEIRHDDGTVTWYAHLATIAVTGGRVGAGEPIGSVGSTGNSTGNHLHFEVHPGGSEQGIDPAGWLAARGVRP